MNIFYPSASCSLAAALGSSCTVLQQLLFTVDPAKDLDDLGYPLVIKHGWKMNHCFSY